MDCYLQNKHFMHQDNFRVYRTWLLHDYYELRNMSPYIYHSNGCSNNDNIGNIATLEF